MKIMMKALMMRMITSLDRVANVQTSWISAGAIKSKFIFNGRYAVLEILC